ncbi:MAG: LacI family DNA-binding transcriptional regulator [Octadecabacter sp.]
MTPKPPTPTLHDVADAASVSTATVSRCLNFPERVSDRTRAKVLNAVKRLGYLPNFGAQAMAAGRTNTIGAIIPTMENAIFARGLQAFQDELHVHGFTMLVASTNYCADLELEQIRSLVARGADALLLIGHERDPEIYDFLRTQGVPFIVTWTYDTAAGHPSVGFDNKTAMTEMATHVIKQGHKQLGFVTASTIGNDRTAARLAGMQAAMALAGLGPDNLTCVETTYGIEQGAVAFEKVMQSNPRPTAVICGNDVLAVGAMRAARELGISVPDDVSITGFDDMELAKVAYPPLCTVHVPHREMGRRAALVLANHLKNGEPLASAKLATHVVLRGSLTPPQSLI